MQRSKFELEFPFCKNVAGQKCLSFLYYDNLETFPRSWHFLLAMPMVNPERASA